MKKSLSYQTSKGILTGLLFVGMMFSTSISTFAQQPFPVPGKIEAEQYLVMVGMKTETCTDIEDLEPGLDVGYVDANDYLVFWVDAAAAGPYVISFRVASAVSTGSFQIKSENRVLGNVVVPNTGGWQKWKTVNVSVTLASGPQVIRITATGSGLNINWLSFASSNRFEAENYDRMSGVQTETCTDAGGGKNVGYLDYLDYMHYPLDITESGVYKISYRVASLNGGGKFILSGNEVDLDVVDVPKTCGWQNWTTITHNVYLNAEDDSILYILVRGGGFNINWFEITKPNKIEAESYDRMVGVQKENCTDIGGGQCVNYSDQYDRTHYPFPITEDGDYTVSYRISSPNGPSQFRLIGYQIDYDLVDVPNTGCAWQTITHNVHLHAADDSLLILIASVPGFKVNWIEVTKIGLKATGDEEAASNFENTSEFTVYPNPVINLLHFPPLSQSGLMQLFDLSGKLIMQENLEPGRKDVDVSNLSNGFYIMKVNVGKEQYIQKVVKK
jgi:endoglucanase